MNVLVFGAAGLSGRQVVRQARAAGHTVTAFVRDAAVAKLDGVRMFEGDATEAGEVAAAIAGHEAVISTLGMGKTLRSNHLIERCLSGIVPAMERSGVRQLIVMSALGVGRTRAQAPLLPRIAFRLFLQDIYADKERGERIVEASRLEWMVAHPPLLTDGPMTGSYRAEESVALSGFPRISRADVAHFMVASLGADRWMRKHVIVTSG